MKFLIIIYLIIGLGFMIKYESKENKLIDKFADKMFVTVFWLPALLANLFYENVIKRYVK